ncbi:MAG: hypothetical protein ABIJ34_07695 [archaeon]
MKWGVLLLVCILCVSAALADTVMDAAVFKTDATHNLTGFSAIENSTYMYADCDGASFTMNATYDADYVWIRFLTTPGDDSFSINISSGSASSVIGRFNDTLRQDLLATAVFFLPSNVTRRGLLTFTIGECDSRLHTLYSAALFSRSGGSSGNDGKDTSGTGTDGSSDKSGSGTSTNGGNGSGTGSGEDSGSGSGTGGGTGGDGTGGAGGDGTGGTGTDGTGGTGTGGDGTGGTGGDGTGGTGTGGDGTGGTGTGGDGTGGNITPKNRIIVATGSYIDQSSKIDC